MPFNNKRNSREDSTKRGGNSDRRDNGNRSSFNAGDKGKFRPKRSESGSFNRSENRDSDRNNDSRFKKDFDRKDRGFEKKSDRPFKKDFDKKDRSFDGRDKKFDKPFKKDFDRKDRDFDKRSDRPFKKDFDKKDFRNESREEGNDKTRKFGVNRKFSPAKNPASQQPKDDKLIRLNRYIANSGICSRRKADELIEAGVISVNGEVVTELGTKVDPAKDEIRYNNERLKREKMVYVLLNKPKDYITTTDDPQERKTVMELVSKATRERIYPVGRLDRNTTGLLLLTNDGNLAEKLSHPRNNISKIYHVELSKSLTQGDFNKIQFGLELEDGPVKPDDLSYVSGASKREVGIQIHSGKNRIVRRIFEHLGYEVVKLDRVVYANLTKKDLPRGRWRYLDEKELVQLKHFIK